MVKFSATLITQPSEEAKQHGIRQRMVLSWTTDHPASHAGAGVLVYAGGEILDGSNFRGLRDALGSWIKTNDPKKACQALGVPVTEPGIVKTER